MSVVVIGGGIVGCHVALRLAEEGKEVSLLEKERALGEHTSTRNSGVIHAGIYYSQGSLKAKLCVRGRHLTYDFLARYGVPHLKCGKLIVALQGKELKALEELKNLGDLNGVENLSLLDRGDVKQLEPRVRCLAALHSPETGILDMAAYMRTLERVLRQLGVTIVKPCKVLSIEGKNRLVTTRGETEAEIIVNAAGLHSDHIAKLCGVEGYEVVPYKGDYYQTTEEVIHGLVYPVPDSPLTLGIHLTRTLGAETLIGPTVLRWREKEDYELRTPRQQFEQGALAMIPDLRVERICPAYSGNRPKLFFRGGLEMDFVILKQETGKIHLLGIESPGLTAAPAIAEYVAQMVSG